MVSWTEKTVATAARLWAERSRSDPRVTINEVAGTFGIPCQTLARYISRQVLEQERRTHQPLRSDELPLGLAKIGSISFANAVVQCLRVLPGFVERLVADTARTRVEALRDGDDSERAKQWRVADALCNLMDGVAPDCEHEEGFGEDGSQVLVGCWVFMPRDPVARREQNKAMLRYFRQQVSKCSYLVTAAGDEQEQQDAEVGPIATMLSPLQLSDVLSESNRSSCPSCWSCCTTCSAAAMKCSMTSRSVRPSGWSSC
jgi:hypothetical protein